jgi:GTPase SAR1 family protein
MHVRNISLKNVRSIRELSWSIPESKSTGWHVILGDNGAGKSSFLKAICLALVGANDASALRQPWNDWVTRGQDAGSIRLEIDWSPQDDYFSGKGKTPSETSLLPVEVEFQRNKSADPPHVELSNRATKTDPKRYVWNGGSGWFSASYGPFRRFAGGDAHSEKMFYSMPRLSRHLSLFDERVALTECLDWLRSLKFKKLENDSEGVLLEKVKEFLNLSGFLPSGVRLEEVTSKAVLFTDANGISIPVEDLSDGYRSVLSMTFELIRQFSIAFGPDNVFSVDDPTMVQPSGVVVIDEIDAHLHPTWQKRIGRWFCKHFPNIQFIVSTHSPLVCQSAENGTIFLLPRAGSDGTANFVAGDAFKRLVFGNVLDAYGTEAFGLEAALTRSAS